MILATMALNFQGGVQTAKADASRVTAAVQYHDQWRKLWEEHITWTRSVIVGVLDNLSCTSAYVDRLLQNPGDMSNALQPYYGDAVSAQFKQLITEHLTIAVDVLNAAKAGDTAVLNDAVAHWYANADAIAALTNGTGESHVLAAS